MVWHGAKGEGGIWVVSLRLGTVGEVCLGGKGIDIVEDEDPPSNSPLLECYQPTAFGWRRKFRDVDGNLGRFDANTQSVDEPAGDEHANIL